MPMYRHNDYLNLTREYLRKYPCYQQAVQSISEDIHDIQVRLSSESVKTPSYGDTGGGYAELNGTEQAADRRLWLERQCEELQANRRALQVQLGKVDAAMDKLSAEDRELVQLFYFSRLSHQELSRKFFISERSSKRHVRRATDTIALMLFGLDTQRDVFFLRG